MHDDRNSLIGKKIRIIRTDWYKPELTSLFKDGIDHHVKQLEGKTATVLYEDDCGQIWCDVEGKKCSLIRGVEEFEVLEDGEIS